MEALKIGTAKLSNLHDPFKKGSIERISITVGKRIITKKVEAWGSVEFKKNNTEGTQRFEATDFDTLVLDIRKFIQNLES